jgi:AraC-like DNA-binding protein
MTGGKLAMKSRPALTKSGYCAIQIGFELETNSYQEKTVTYSGKPEHSFLYYQFSMNGQLEEILSAVPDGCIDIIFCCDPNQPTAIIYGSVLKGSKIHFRSNAVYFGVRLTPQQSLGFHNICLREFLNLQIPLADVMGQFGQLGEQMAEQSSFESRIALFEQQLLFVLGSQTNRAINPLIDNCLKEIYLSKGNIAIHELAASNGYTIRHLRRKFEEALGMSPKFFNRIIRFQHTLSFIMNSNSDLQEVIKDQGYYDQSHFIKEFKDFSLITPSQMKTIIDCKRNK